SYFVFFFQAEDGIRDFHVTGVQTCALPILEWDKEPEFIDYDNGPRFININLTALLENPDIYLKPKTYLQVTLDADITYEEAVFRSEERRVGKECRSRGAARA